MPNFLFKFNLLQVNEQVFHIFRIPVLKLLSYECKKITILGHIHEWSSFMLQLKKMIYNLLHHTAR